MCEYDSCLCGHTNVVPAAAVGLERYELALRPGRVVSLLQGGSIAVLRVELLVPEANVGVHIAGGLIRALAGQCGDGGRMRRGTLAALYPIRLSLFTVPLFLRHSRMLPARLQHQAPLQGDALGPLDSLCPSIDSITKSLQRRLSGLPRQHLWRRVLHHYILWKHDQRAAEDGLHNGAQVMRRSKLLLLPLLPIRLLLLLLALLLLFLLLYRL
mmetsp:Transcript_20097/g.44677  ORF Transcript_20097/g.44677 Transcript_20097/m.44677 type:complete len:213 (-) Transcript_20097:697-1335(-)